MLGPCKAAGRIHDLDSGSGFFGPGLSVVEQFLTLEEYLGLGQQILLAAFAAILVLNLVTAY